VNVAVELQKAQTWAAANNRVANRRMFTNWLNRAASDARTVATGPNGIGREGF